MPRSYIPSGRYDAYVTASEKIKALLRSFTPLLEDVGIDEAFHDISDIDMATEEIANKIKEQIREETGLTCSIGIGPNKLLANTASDMKKPDDLTIMSVHGGSMTDVPRTRRAFLASVGALSATGLVAREAAAGVSVALQRGRARSGLAQAPDDFAFAPGLIYLQTGSLGPTPRPVLERAMATWKQLQLNPNFYGYGELEQAMEGVRAQAAAFIGCTPDELVLTNSTSEGMNWTAQGRTLAAGDRVLTTDQEHPGGRVCWDYVVRRYGVVLDVVVKFESMNLFARSGIAMTPDDQNADAENVFGACFGGGISTNAAGLNITIDYAYRSTKFFDANQVFSVKFGF